MKVNLSEVYVDNQIKRAVEAVIDSGWFIHGAKLREFEAKFAEFVGQRYAAGVSSGTAAIHLALASLNVGKGDRIIVPSHTAFPTIEPILALGAVPLFIDVNPYTYTIESDEINREMLREAKGILAVHLYGHPAKLAPLVELAEANELFLIEDCAQAHGSMYDGKRVGSFGRVSCFSFYPSKNMTVCGDGGMVVTDDSDLDERIRLLRNHGMSSNYEHVILGYNYRMSEISAAIGIEQLKKIDQFNETRRRWAELYVELLQDLSIQLPIEKEWAHHVYHLFVIQSQLRDELASHLQKNEVTTGIHYPIPCHLQPAVPVEFRRSLPDTERLVSRILSLPMHPRLTEAQVEHVVKVIREVYKK